MIYNVSLIFIGPWGLVSYYFSVILFFYYRKNDTSNSRYIDVANARYNASKIEKQVRNLIKNISHDEFWPNWLVGIYPENNKW